MNEVVYKQEFLSYGLLLVGLLLVTFRSVLSRFLAGRYHKIGITVPESRYSKQILFVGLILIVLGFLNASGLIEHI